MRCKAKGRSKCLAIKENRYLKKKLDDFHDIIKFLQEILETLKWHSTVRDVYIERVLKFNKLKNPEFSEQELRTLCLRQWMRTRTELIHCQSNCEDKLVLMFIRNTYSYIEIR
jgi:hypothetical protein